MLTRIQIPRVWADGDGGTLRLRLLALVLIPVVGSAAFAGLRVSDSISVAHAARAADGYIRAAAALSAARGAFEQEILPAFAATVTRDPAVLSSLATPAELQAAAAITLRLPGLRRETDSAVAALAAQPPIATDGRRFVTELASARAAIDDPTLLSSALSTATVLLTSLVSAENGQIAAATHQQLSEAGTQALDDVRLLERATSTASEELELYVGTQFTSAGAPGGRDEDWAKGWGAYTAASAAVSERAGSVIAARWAAVNAVPAVGAFNQFLTSQLVPSGSLSVSRTIELIVEDGRRNQAYMAVLAAALDRVLDAGRAQRRTADLELITTVIAGLLLAGVSVILALWARRSVTRPLDRLAAQATLISRGELTDVLVGGPREVRTVARALSSTVASLRDIEAHAAAVAAGNLDSSAVHHSLPGPLGEVVHASVARIVAAINEREQAQQALAHRAGHDALTELPNRSQALTLVEQALHRGQRRAAESALMFVDLDYFKDVNDSLGHATGDAVLQAVARRMTRVVRDGDIVARLGGDEFIVLIEDVEDEAAVFGLAERLVAEISREVVLGAHSVRVGASIGISYCRDGYVDADRILNEADAALYRAKTSGRGRVDVFDDGLRAELQERAEIESAATAGLDGGEFDLFYQPIIDLQTGVIESVEALIRWDRPEHGLVLPDQFIPIAERSTLIISIGRWVLREATDRLAAWERAEPSLDRLRVAVNISGRHLVSDDLVPDVTAALAHSGIEPNRLILELTETVAIDDVSAIRNVHTLRALGVEISLDDFGTGFTSIGQLSRMPVDSIKIDRSFVGSSDPSQQELVRLMVASAHAFGIKVIAEGIEREEQADQLRSVAAEYGQGHLFSRPKPPELILPTLLLGWRPNVLPPGS